MDININNGLENHSNHCQGFNFNVIFINGEENHHQQHQDLNNNNGMVEYYKENNNYQEYQGLNESINSNNSVENYDQECQGLNNNVSVNNGVENYHYQQHQFLNNNVNINVNNGENTEVEYLDSFPVGYRFFPTDKELTAYLKRKVFNKELPPNRIHEVKFYQQGPEELAAMYRPNDGRVWFFFTSRNRKYENGNRPDRGTGEGYWKASGADKEIATTRGVVVGFKKALVYYAGKAPNGVKTNWILHEYRLNNPPPVVRGPSNHMQLDKWVLCRIYHKDGNRNDAVDDQSSSTRASISCPLQVDCDTPLTSSLHLENNVQLNGREVTSHVDPNSNDFLAPICPLSTSLDPNSWQYRAMFHTSYSIMDSVNPNYFPGNFSDTHSDNKCVVIKDSDIPYFLHKMAPHNGAITQQPVPIENIAQQSASSVAAQQLASAAAVAIPQQSKNNAARQLVPTGVVAQQLASNTGFVYEQSASRDDVGAPFYRSRKYVSHGD